MALGDIIPYENSNAAAFNGTLKFLVASGTTASIKAGEPVQKIAGAAAVTSMLTNSPTTTNRIVGVAMSTSNETASVAGTVDVVPATIGQLWLIKPKVTIGFTDTQANYNSQVGKRVLIDLTSSSFTLLAADGASNGVVVEYLDISRYPGMVAISWSLVVDYRNV